MNRLVVILGGMATAVSLQGGCRAPATPYTLACTRLTQGYWQVFLLSDDADKARQLTYSPTDKRYPVWMPDGRRILYRDNNGRAYVLDCDTGQQSRALEELGAIAAASPSPRDDRVVAVRTHAETPDRTDLWLTDLRGSFRKMLTKDLSLQHDPAWSPDARQIAYVSGYGVGTHEIVVLDIDSGRKIQLTKDESLELLPSYSPDGRRLAYASDRSGDFEIWVCEGHDAPGRRLTVASGIDTRPCWSPEGGRLLFVSHRSGELQLWVMNSNGTDQRQLTHGAPTMDPAWKGREHAAN